MEQINDNKEESILNYLHLFSSFVKFLKSSYDLFNKNFLKKKDSFETIKFQFEEQNFDNETDYIKNEALLSLLPNEDLEITKKAKNAKLKVIKDTLGIDLTKNLDEELIFDNINKHLTNMEEILNNCIKPIIIRKN